jgi:hypothetical protein
MDPETTRLLGVAGITALAGLAGTWLGDRLRGQRDRRARLRERELSRVTDAREMVLALSDWAVTYAVGDRGNLGATRAALTRRPYVGPGLELIGSDEATLRFIRVVQRLVAGPFGSGCTDEDRLALTAARLQCIAVLDAQARRVLADEPLLRVGADAQTAGRELVALLSSRLPLSDADARVARDGPEPATRSVGQAVGLLDRP